MALSTSLAFIWPGSVSTIPTAWTRETLVDSRYPYTLTEGDDGYAGAFDGAESHTHVLSGGVHTISAGASTGTLTPTVFGTKYAAATDLHTHGNSTSKATAFNSGSATNNPAHIDVIFIKPADGSRQGIPPSAWSFFSGSSLPDDWSLPDAAKDILLRGAPAGSGSSLTPSGSNATHSHTGTHGHGSKNSAIASGATASQYPTASNRSGAQAGHVHSLELTAIDPGMSSEISEPGWQKVAVIQNDTGTEDLPDSVLALYFGLVADFPVRWVLHTIVNSYACLKGATDLTEIGDVGGDINLDHVHTLNAHGPDEHVLYASMAVTLCGTNGSGAAVASDYHEHVWTVGSATGTCQASTTAAPPLVLCYLLRFERGVEVTLGVAAATSSAPNISVVAPIEVTLGVAASASSAPSISVVAPVEVTLDVAAASVSAPPISVASPVVVTLQTAGAAGLAPNIEVVVLEGVPVEITTEAAVAICLAPDIWIRLPDVFEIAPGRKIVPVSEPRLVLVAWEDRTLTMPPSSVVATLPPENRIVTVTPETRTVLVGGQT